MIPKNRTATHPGEVLREEFLEPHRITQVEFARHIGVSEQEISLIVNEKRGISATMAWKLAEAIGTTPEFWMGLQASYDLTKNRPESHIRKIKKAG